MGFDDSARPAFTFPMRNGDGLIVGFRTRPLDDMHAKLCIAGGHLGLFIPKGITPGNCEIIAEGESDTLAALTTGLKAIGVPGAGEAVAEAVRYFALSAVSCPCIIADNDEAGIAGAEKLQAGLLAGGIPCRLLPAPEDAKDLREYFKAHGTAEDLRAAIAKTPVSYPVKWPWGFYRLPHAAIRRGLVKQIGRGPVILAVTIASFFGKEGTGFPDRDTLADLCDASRAQIDRWKRTLAAAGVLTWEKGHKGKANVYRLNFGPLPSKPRAK
jgi:hypothetical protein